MLEGAEGFGPSTARLVVGYSIRLSYAPNKREGLFTRIGSRKKPFFALVDLSKAHSHTAT